MNPDLLALIRRHLEAENAHDLPATLLEMLAEHVAKRPNSEAVIELDLSGAPCLVFQHGSSGRVNIIYRRADGNVGWIDPPGGKADGKAGG